MSSIEEVKARLIQLAQDVPVDLFNEANHRMLDVTDGMRALVAGTTNDSLKETLERLEGTNSETIDAVGRMIEIRDEFWRVAESL